MTTVAESDSEEKVLVFNIQRYSVHDGPGIRTIVFLKGCPLNCPWCSNPEGKRFQRDILHNANLCRKCGRCLRECPAGAISMQEAGIVIDRSECTFCGSCVKVCRTDALKIFGNPMSADEILACVIKDESFYKHSGGGLTVSGGEPLAHAGFLLQLLKKAKNEYLLNTAIETSCYASEEALRRVIDYIDYFLVDIKLIDSARHQKVLGVPNESILKNIRTIADEYPDKPLVLRMPVIPTVNDDRENILGISGFLTGLKRRIPIELLPYHEFGKAKYAGIGDVYSLDCGTVVVPDKDYMNGIEAAFTEAGVTVIHT
ncbi:MAG: glycyl-radical enzyme activating protein [Treponemataceae bacterium]